MKSLKVFISLLLAALMVLSVAACTKPTDNPENPTSAPTEKVDDPTKAPDDATDAPSDPTEVPTPKPTAVPDPFLTALQSEEGYSLDMELVEFTNAATTMKISEITDEAVKTALLNAGHKEDDVVVFAESSPSEITNDLLASDYPEIYEPGNSLAITLETYGTGSGSKGYVIAMDDTSGNHLIAQGVVKEGYSKKTYEWVVGDANERCITFFEWPANTYIAGINLRQLNKPNQNKIFVNDMATRDITDAELAAGYTYDFSADNVPDLGVSLDYVKIAEITDDPCWAEIKANLTAENGFKDYAFASSNGECPFYFLRNLPLPGHTYKITMRVYSKETLGAYCSHMLPIHNCEGYSTSGYQCNCEGSKVMPFDATPVEGLANMYDIVGIMTLTEDSDVNMFISYPKSGSPMYVASITVEDIPAPAAE